ncbi:sialate O-acetylesterase [Chitinophaga polysaccharea]|uniref:sialate O-acetylesterase n=1 Tax=Chitinophaga polysaccharea TaxID=1293035 RepID=UPI001455481C|nr:sialate O-acetylesterase [Chitinophaga polysaccharea]NLR56848.1 sialate O-acetylesterase [Chitinophaga polysaccharea]
MRWIITIICFLSLSDAMGQNKTLFLAAGQSNAVGQGDSTLAVHCTPGTAFEYYFSRDSLVALKDPAGQHELQFEKAHSGSAWPAFAKAYHDLTGSEVIIVQTARGGSSCHYNAELSNYGTWDNRGRMPLFGSAVIKAKAASRKTGLPVAGILWCQGERDANAVNAQQLSPEAYEQQLTLLINQFRAALGKQVNFYIIQTGYYLHHPTRGFDAVRKAQENVAGKMKRVFIVYRQTNRFNEKGWMKDDIHYHQPALNDIGSEVAKQVALKEKK